MRRPCRFWPQPSPRSLARRPNLTKCALALACALFAGPALAQQQPPAVGRLSYGASDKPGAAICTGTLIAPDLVLTAGHCLPAAAQANPASVRFLPGLGTVSAGPERRGSAVLEPPPRPGPLVRMGSDIALLRLQSPYPADEVTPLALATGIQSGPFTFFGYDRARPGLAPAATRCAALALFPPQSPQVAGLDCTVVSGNSGGPLLVRVPGGTWLVAGVMVARAGPPLHALAVLTTPDLMP